MTDFYVCSCVIEYENGRTVMCEDCHERIWRDRDAYSRSSTPTPFHSYLEAAEHWLFNCPTSTTSTTSTLSLLPPLPLPPSPSAPVGVGPRGAGAARGRAGASPTTLPWAPSPRPHGLGGVCCMPLPPAVLRGGVVCGGCGFVPVGYKCCCSSPSPLVPMPISSLTQIGFIHCCI